MNLTPLTDHVFWLPPDSRTDRPTLGVVVGERGTLLVDAGNSASHARLLADELQRLGLAPPAYVALTHWHWDHVFGAAAFDVPTFAHADTQRIVAEMAALDWRDAALDQRVVEGREIAFCRDMMKAELTEVERAALRLRVPDVAFHDGVELWLGGTRCQLLHVGGDHAADSTVVWVPEERVLFLSDCAYPAIYDEPRYWTGARLFPLLERLLAFEADWFVWGHDEAPMTRAAMEAEVALYRAVGEAVARHGGDRAAALAALRPALPAESDDDLAELIALFACGLGKG